MNTWIQNQFWYQTNEKDETRVNVHPRRLHVHLRSAEAANHLIKSAKNLCQNYEIFAKINIYINRDLSLTEAKLTFEICQQRRRHRLRRLPWYLMLSLPCCPHQPMPRLAPTHTSISSKMPTEVSCMTKVMTASLLFAMLTVSSLPAIVPSTHAVMSPPGPSFLPSNEYSF